LKQTLHKDRECKEEIKKLEDQERTVLCNWVKAHGGMQGNEMADRLAEKAATDVIGDLV